MDHPRIDDEHILDRYLAGQLSAGDEARFEEHLFACAPCLQQVQAGEELRRGLRAVAAEEAARVTVAAGLLAWLRRRSGGQLAGILSVALALVVLPAVVLWQGAELRRLRGAPPPPAAGITEPVAGLPVISLGQVRDAGDGVPAIQPDPTAGLVLLSLDLPAGAAARYRVTLRAASGEVRWQSEDVQPSLYGTVLLVLPSSFLVPGDYRITLEPEPAMAGETPAELAFRVLPAE